MAGNDSETTCDIREVFPWFKCRFALRAGVALVSEVALFSFVCLSGLLIVILIRVLKRRARTRNGKAFVDDEPLQPVAFLFILAMVMELIQAFANILSVRWAFEGTTTPGTYCTTQATIKQLGDDGAALFTMFIAIMTVLPTIRPTLLMGDRGRKIVWGMIAFVCLFFILMIGVPVWTIDEYFGSTGPWCWIPTRKADGKVSKLAAVMEILTLYGWFWLASFVCFICYGIVIWKWCREAKEDADPELLRQAVVMVWYPIAYFVEIFPHSVIRISSMHAALSGTKPPSPGWTIFTTFLFASSGWVNTLLWIVTGRQFGFTAASTRVGPIGRDRSGSVEGGKSPDSTIENSGGFMYGVGGQSLGNESPRQEGFTAGYMPPSLSFASSLPRPNPLVHRHDAINLNGSVSYTYSGAPLSAQRCSSNSNSAPGYVYSPFREDGREITSAYQPTVYHPTDTTL